MSRVVGDLEAAHGSVREYLRSVGVGDDDLRVLEDQLLTS